MSAKAISSVESSSSAAKPVVLPEGWQLALAIGSVVLVIAFGALALAMQTSIDFMAQDFNQAGQFASQRAPTRSSLRGAVASVHIARIVVQVTSGLLGLVFLAWFYRMHQNLPALGARPQLSSLVWVLLLLIPVVNVITIVPALLDLWRGSDPAKYEDSSSKRTEPTVVFVWWVMGLALAGAAVYLYFNPPNLRDLNERMNFVIVLWGLCAAMIVQQLLFILMLHTLTKLQQARNDLVNAPRPMTA